MKMNRTVSLREKLVFMLAAAFVLTLMVGCAGPSLPQSLEVELPDGSKVEAEIGTGPASLANSEWEVYRVSSTGQAAPFVTLVFDENGSITKFEDNTIAPEIFGDTIILDGQRHSTAQAGLSYSAGVYGADTEDGTEIALETRIKGFAAGIQAATVEARVAGTYTDDTRTSMTGVFSYKSVVPNFIPNGNVEDEFNFRADRADRDLSGD